MFWLILGCVMVPTQALAVPTWLLFAEVDLTNSPLSIILPCSVSPFGVFLMRIYAERAIDSSLIEAARLDGAGEWRIFRSIVFRLLAPGMVTVMLFAFVQTWNNYLLPLLMLSESKWYPLTIGLTQIGYESIVGSLIAIVPMIGAFVLLQRFWQNGLAAGSSTSRCGPAWRRGRGRPGPRRSSAVDRLVAGLVAGVGREAQRVDLVVGARRGRCAA